MKNQELKIISGIQTQLVEMTEEDAADVVRLRNDPKNNRYLFQDPISESMQLEWIRSNRNRNDNVNFVVRNKAGEFSGTISIYDIRDGQGEFGRYIVTNSINAVESEYLLLKFCFEELKLNKVYCQTNVENTRSWKLHLKLGFQRVGEKEVKVGTGHKHTVKAYVQEISREQYLNFDYTEIFNLLNHF